LIFILEWFSIFSICWEHKHPNSDLSEYQPVRWFDLVAVGILV